PLPTFCFHVKFIEMTGTVETFFKSVSGLRSETEVIPVRAGGANDTTFNLVGSTKWAPLVLKQGFCSGSKLLEWREAWLTPGKDMVRSSGTIILLDTALTPKAAWKFHQGWPTKWDMSEWDEGKNELAIESIEIAHNGLEVVAPPA